MKMIIPHTALALAVAWNAPAHTQEDLVILGDEIAADWTTTALGGIELVDISPEGPVFEGETAAVLRVEKARSSGWTLQLRTSDSRDLLGFTTLRFAFHPESVVPPDSPRLAVAVQPGRSIDLLQEGLIDLNWTEWQVVEMDLSEFDLGDRFERISFLGNVSGTFYLDDLRLVHAPDDAPIVTSITPPHGVERGDMQVEIRGSNFYLGTTVAFGGIEAARRSRLSPFLIQATTPPHALGSVDVTITNRSQETGKLEKGFTFVPALFALPTDYPVGRVPLELSTADFDGDGDHDLAVASTGSNTVSVLMNRGDGTFADKVDYALGRGSHPVFGADFDSDGDHDLAVANGSDANVSVFLNNGDGTFADKVDYATGEAPVSLFSADFDGNGIHDLVVARVTGSNVSVLLNNGDGTFGPPIDYVAGKAPLDVFSADLDGDTDNDLVVANHSGGVSVLLNDGDGTFAPKVEYDALDRPVNVFSADFDGDEDHDIAARHFGSAAVSVWLNNGDGSFAPRVDYDGPERWGIFSADLDNDGDNDLVAPDHVNRRVSVLLNNGDGTFGVKLEYAVGRGPYEVVGADFDGDGDIDLAVTNQDANTVSILLNRLVDSGVGDPVLAVDQDYLDFGVAISSLSLSLRNAGSGILSWSLEPPSEDWISVSPREGQTTNVPAYIEVRIDRQQAPAGPQEATLVLTTPQGERREVRVRADIRTSLLRYVDPVFSEVHLTLDLPFGEAIGSSRQLEQLRLDVYEPEGDTEVNRPALMLIHGGGFSRGDKQSDLYQEMATAFAQRGYVAVSINYRLANPSANPAIIDTAVADALTALNWLETNQDEYGVDPNKMTIAGDSAGGAIAVNLCYGNAASVGAAACIDLWGGMYDRSDPGGFDAPIYPGPIEPGTPPTLLIHGTEDSIVPYRTSLDLIDKIAAAKVHYELYPLPGAGHYPISLASQFIPVMVDFVYRLVHLSKPSTAVVEVAESISDLPTTYTLSQNYPNPFNSDTVIRFGLPTSGPVDLALYNLAGQKVAALVEGPHQAGTYTVHWDGRDAHGRDLASGVYMYRLLAGGQTETRKLLFLR